MNKNDIILEALDREIDRYNYLHVTVSGINDFKERADILSEAKEPFKSDSYHHTKEFEGDFIDLF